MASFKTAYEKYIKPWEGGYAFVAGDKGGETYAGIARNFHPDWPGWSYIDQVKKTRSIKHNEHFPALDEKVEKFFNDFWNTQRLSEIKSQEVANIIYDFYVNSEKSAIKVVQRLVGVSQDGLIGPKTLQAINSFNPAELNNLIKEEREKFYLRIVDRDPTQLKFITGWMNRINSFPTLATGISVLLILFLCIAFLFLTH